MVIPIKILVDAPSVLLLTFIMALIGILSYKYRQYIVYLNIK